MRFIILLVLLALPLLEIAVFIKVGEWLGAPLTILLVVLSAVVGLWIVRLQGFSLLTKARDSLRQNAMPVGSVVHGAFLVVAGILLAIPGFLTDLVAFALLIPPVRVMIARIILEKVRRSANVSIHVGGNGMRGGAGPFRSDHRTTGEGPVIEGELVEDLTPPEPNAPGGSSGSGGSPPGGQRPPSPWRG
ncbi:FxsA family protein [Rhodoligotrophos defluvii]|uniref:FxsA family protein n=1 Tax=Rhodoligotrophos defluvii TaxID=2561934 RepID=UPI001484CE8B|nr:FxsA family protein [Rhodoligotrophos defluvii]